MNEKRDRHEQWKIDNARLRELTIMRQKAAARERRPAPRRPSRHAERRVTNTEIPVPTLDLPVTAMALVRDISQGGVQITTRSPLDIGDRISFGLIGAAGEAHVLTGIVRHVSWNGGIGECTAGLAWEAPTPQALATWRDFFSRASNVDTTHSEDWVVLTGQEIDET